jgi:hypothetical protein
VLLLQLVLHPREQVERGVALDIAVAEASIPRSDRRLMEGPDGIVMRMGIPFNGGTQRQQARGK